MSNYDNLQQPESPFYYNPTTIAIGVALSYMIGVAGFIGYYASLTPSAQQQLTEQFFNEYPRQGASTLESIATNAPSLKQ